MLTEEEKKKLREIEASLRVKASGHSRIASKETGQLKYKFVGRNKIQHSGIFPVYRPEEGK